MYMLYIWIAVIVLGIIVEMIDAGTLISVWVSVGAIIPLFMSIYRTNMPGYIIAQVVVFGVVTSLCIIFLRKIAIKTLYRHSEKTNLDQYVGKTLKVIALREENKLADVKLNGIIYTAMKENEAAFSADEMVEIVRFEGNKIIVKGM